ncbi:2-keto-4-pentenoate hydratase [Burkholderia multivorans]|uniref:2-keto-4-pentenoate hydratase n=1 Tax=Burkholderia multivorans TaxID=87883 RepID=UPI0020193C68|nr:2-keto-4-pentenoate hydratase [Burkholderia multivorans]MCL4661359.1 2-keto-4-pentenoate hydratase [Burkholderia multivorans]MCO1352789.1 2-keto-4-pentenoate hydratase [Burkholderia multivorans]MCO1413364.1 2-keto-4-pentenoate hydratase [Burkholderia multivorans]MCO1446445.1 2-keto-4-pentenoate hydratase [Burkholderia multivorans]UQP46858.1 2-keto-4-pentenoate hydratase [Burkholderia multivorans]
MTEQDYLEAAHALLSAIEERTPIAPLRERYPTLDMDGAYRVQQHVTDHGLSRGRRIVGRKIGLTSQAVQKQLGVDQPDFGVLFADMAYGDAEPVPVQSLLQPKVEAEIAVVIGKDLPHADTGFGDVIRAIDYALPAIEIVDSRIARWDIRIADTVADNASSGAFVLGSSPKQLKDIDLRLCGMVLERGGEPVSFGAGKACLGNPLNAVVWLARKLASLGTPLKAGDIVLSGALGPMVAVNAGDSFEAHIAGLGSVRALFSGAGGQG